jgi:hypothetical protein
MGRKSHHLMERVYAHLSKNGYRKSGLLADPELTVTLLMVMLMSLLSSEGLTSAFKSEDTGYESACRYLFQIL